jgi:hypothetical protein
MLNRGILKAAIPIIIAVASGVVSTALPASAATSAVKYRITQPAMNGTGTVICLDAGFESSRCQYGKSPDDPPALEKWTLVTLPNGTDQIKNFNSCLDLNGFTGPCSAGDANQQWTRVSVGNGRVNVVNVSATGQRTCLDSFWTFKTCLKGDKQQIWRFKQVS